MKKLAKLQNIHVSELKKYMSHTSGDATNLKSSHSANAIKDSNKRKLSIPGTYSNKAAISFCPSRTPTKGTASVSRSVAGNYSLGKYQGADSAADSGNRKKPLELIYASKRPLQRNEGKGNLHQPILRNKARSNAESIERQKSAPPRRISTKLPTKGKIVKNPQRVYNTIACSKEKAITRFFSPAKSPLNLDKSMINYEENQRCFINASNSYFHNVTITPSTNLSFLKETGGGGTASQTQNDWIMKTFENAKKISEGIKRRLEEIDSNVSRGGDIKKVLIGNIFNEVIENDPLYGDILKMIKKHYDDLDTSAKEKMELAGVKKTNKKLSDEIEAIKERHQKLLHELSGVKAENMLHKKTFKEQLRKVTEENKKLKEDMQAVGRELKRSKTREATLASWLKGENAVAVLNRSPEENANTIKAKGMKNKGGKIGEVEVGKNKVKIPKLDLSVLNKDEDEEEIKDSSPSSSSEDQLAVDLDYRKKRVKMVLGEGDT